VAFPYDREGLPPFGVVVVEAYNQANNLFYRRFELKMNNTEAQCLLLNSAPTNYHDMIAVAPRIMTGALTALINAERGASGGRNAELNAVEDACASLGIFDTSLV